MKKGSSVERGQPRSVASLRGAIANILRRCPRAARVATTVTPWILGSMGAYAQPPATPPTDSPAALGEIVVTAQRRSETLQDVPYNITVVPSAEISASGATSLNDLTRVVPGLVTVDTGEGARGRTDNLTLRGLRTDSPGGGQTVAEVPGQSVSPVSTYFGETPVFFPMPVYDIERVEVLRGPQGTLYGSGSQAGTIRFVPTPPQFDKFSGEMQATVSDTEHASGFGNLNKDFQGFLNIPLADHLALRLVGGREHDGGFINNVDLFEREGAGGVHATPTPSVPGDLTSGPVIGPQQNDTNTAEQWFTRAALRWQPSDGVNLQLDYVHQYVDSANAQYTTPGYAGGTLDLTTASPLPPSATNPGAYPNSSFRLNPAGTYDSAAFTLSPYTDKLDLMSGVATVDLGMATLTSASSFYEDKTLAVADYTPAFFSNAGFNFNNYPPYLNYPRMLPIQEVPAEDRAFIQEIRLVSSGENRFDYVVGAFYERQLGKVVFHQSMPGIQDYLSAIGQPNPSEGGDENWRYERDTTFEDVAGFGELTWHLTKAWQVTGGVRVFHQSFDTNSDSAFLLCGALCSQDLTNPTGLSVSASSLKTTRAIKKLNTSYDFTPDLKVYATYSEGFRRGGANALPLAGTYATLPQYQTFSPDFAKNYEVGVKGALLDRRLQYSADIYRIDISNFQFDGENFSYFPATYNGAHARSQGVELELHASLTRDTQFSLGYDYTDAKVTSSFVLYDYPTYATVPSLGGNGQTAPLFGGPITAGTPLPGIPKSTATFALDHKVALPALGSEAEVKLHIDGAYRSQTTASILTNTPFNWEIPSSFSGNMRASFKPGGPMTYDVFVNNFTDCLCYSGGQNIQTYPNYSRDRYIARPRTVGLTVTYDF